MTESDADLCDVLRDAQRLGFLGARPIPEVIAHARGFVRALDDRDPIESVLDLGAGGGVPGLVIAHDRPGTRVTLLDRRAKRTDFLLRVVHRLGWQDRVRVVCEDADTFGPAHSYDAVVARGFAAPETTLTAAARLVRSGGVIVISEPPGADRWDEGLLDRLRVRREFLADDIDDIDDIDDGGAATRSPDRRLEGLVAAFRAL